MNMTPREKLAYDFLKDTVAKMESGYFKRPKPGIATMAKHIAFTLSYDGPFQPGTLVCINDHESGKFELWAGPSGMVEYVIDEDRFMVRYLNNTGSYIEHTRDLHLPNPTALTPRDP